VKVRERHSEQASCTVSTETYNLKKLNEGDIKGQLSGYNQKQVCGLENLENTGDANKA
jgi:hypothetical protein